MNEKMRPCPFCGCSEFSFGYESYSPKGNSERPYLQCDCVSCGYRLESVKETDTFNDIAKAHNARPIEDRLQKRIALLAEALIESALDDMRRIGVVKEKRKLAA